MRKFIVVLGLLCVCFSANAALINPTWHDRVVEEDNSCLAIRLDAEVLSKPAKAGQAAEYEITVKNVSELPQTVKLSLDNVKFSAMSYSLSDESLSVGAGQSGKFTLKVTVDEKIPVGGQESVTVVATPGDKCKAQKLEFITVRYRPHPFVLVTPEILAEVKHKIESYDWAKNNLASLEKFAQKYKVPARKKRTNKMHAVYSWTGFTYGAGVTEDAWRVAIAYKLSGKTEYRDKVLKLLRDVCDPVEGYPSTRWFTSSSVLVHEGRFSMFLAAIYDIMHSDEALTARDRTNIENTLRLYIETSRRWHRPRSIGNHLLSANTGSLLASLVLQDMKNLDYFVKCPGGFADQLAQGITPDNWWLEGASGYCYLVMNRYSLAAQAFDNWGFNLFDSRFPTKVRSGDSDDKRTRNGYLGMKFDIWGPPGKNTRGLRDLFEGPISMMNENGYLVANNDSTTAGPQDFYEIAYRHYRDDQFAWVASKLKRAGWRSLLYGLGELPKVKDPRAASAHIDNTGITVLRSQTPGRDSSEQIAAYLKWGSHGGWHGQFDRTGMLALDRYGHKLFSTEMCWFGYGVPGYKECVQTTSVHNIVVVDQLQQESLPSEQPLFYAGEMMQASCVETIARWRKNPVFNPKTSPPWIDFDFDPDFKPVLQRRLTVVTDDYVVIADYMGAPQEHTYDWFIHPIGFKSIEGAKKVGGVIEKLSDDVESSYKYFTDCQWYQMYEPTKVQFYDEPLCLDVYTLWPNDAEAMIGKYPCQIKGFKGERNNPNRRTYSVRAKAKEQIFLTVLDVYKDNSAIEKIESKKPDRLQVWLKDGRVQELKIDGLKADGKDIAVTISEMKNGKTIRNETTLK